MCPSLQLLSEAALATYLTFGRQVTSRHARLNTCRNGAGYERPGKFKRFVFDKDTFRDEHA